MKDTTYTDQSATIRTLTEEEVSVVSGGVSDLIARLTNGTFYNSPAYKAFQNAPVSRFVPAHPTANDFFPIRLGLNAATGSRFGLKGFI